MTRAVSAWSFACLSGLLGLVTAALWRDERRAELISMAGSEVSKQEREQAVTLLIVGTFAVLAVVLLLTALLTARLPKGGKPARVFLTIVALAQLGLVPATIPILTASQWEGVVTSGLLALQALLGLVGAVLMWLPGSRRR